MGIYSNRPRSSWKKSTAHVVIHHFPYFQILCKIDILFRRYCARLIYGWGGKYGPFYDTDDQASLLQEMINTSMSQVREKINFYLSKGYDKRVPIRTQEQCILEYHEASTKLIASLGNNPSVLDAESFIHDAILKLRNIFGFIGDNIVPYLSAVPLEGVKSGFDLKTEFSLLLQMVSDEALYEENHDSDQGYCAYDSEEEARLFDELDLLLETQERAEMFRGNSFKFMANSFQKAFLRISELENAFKKVFFLFEFSTRLLSVNIGLFVCRFAMHFV